MPKDTVLNADIEEIEFEDRTAIDDDNDNVEQTIINEFGDSAKDIRWHIKVYRIASQGRGDEPYLFTCDPSDLPIDDRLRDEYGSGKYRARVYKNNVLYRRFDIAVEKTNAAPRAVANPNTDLGAVIADAMAKQSAMLMGMMQAFMTRQAPVAAAPAYSDPFDVMSKTVTMVTTMMGSQNNRPDPMEYFTKGIEIAAQFSGGGGGETGALDLVKEFIKSPVAAAIADGTLKRRPRQTPDANVRPQPQAQPVRQQAPALPPMLAPYASELAVFVKAAARSSAPELYADMLLDGTFPDIFVKQLLDNDAALDQLGGAVPQVTQYKDWFKSVIDAARAMVNNEAGGADQAPNADKTVPDNDAS